MRISAVLSSIAFALTVIGPVASVAAPAAFQLAQATAMSPSQMQTAVKNALQASNLTLHQKRQIAPMVQNYRTQTENADAATKKSAQETLLKNIYGVLTPDQQAKFKASLKASMAAAHQ